MPVFRLLPLLPSLMPMMLIAADYDAFMPLMRRRHYFDAAITRIEGGRHYGLIFSSCRVDIFV